MLKVKTPEGYPPEEGRYIRGNDLSPVAVCVILDNFDYNIPPELQRLVTVAAESGAAFSGMLQTEGIGMEKMICNIVANPNIRYILLCGRESSGHTPGEALITLKQNGVDNAMRIIGSTALSPYLPNLPRAVVDRFREQIVCIIDLLCKPGQQDTNLPGLNPKVIERIVLNCIQEEPVEFMDYCLYDVGAYPEPAIVHKITSNLEQPQFSHTPLKEGMDQGLRLRRLLPNTDCHDCGRKTCLAFGIDLAKGKATLDECPHLEDPKFATERQALKELLD